MDSPLGSVNDADWQVIGNRPAKIKGEGGFLIHLVTGKGGVGKSTYAAALALHLADKGRKTLLIEFGDRSYQRHLFQIPVSFDPVSVKSHLSLSIWDGETCLREYLHHLLKVDRLVSLFFDNKIMRALVQAAPALKELALVGKLTSRERSIGPAMPFDELVVDAYSTGHFRALWRAPRGMAEAIPFGSMGEQSRGMEKVICDPTKTTIYVVTTPDELSVSEGLELAADIQRELNQKPKFILNRWLPGEFNLSELKALTENEFARYVVLQMERQASAEAKVKERGFSFEILPWSFVDSPSERVRKLAGELK